MFELGSIGQLGVGVYSGWITSSQQQPRNWKLDNMRRNTEVLTANCYMCIALNKVKSYAP